MASSGTFTFSLDIHEIIEEAYELTGLEVKSGYQLKSARRALDLMLTGWINEGINLWTINQLETTLTSGTASYVLSAKYVDLLDAVTRDSNNIDSTANRITLSEYLSYPDKTTSGKPTQYAIERNTDEGDKVYVYPVPNDTYTLVSWAMNYPEDTGNYTDNPDIPRRFLPPLVNGLAYNIALKNPTRMTPGEQGGQPTHVGGVSAGHRKELLDQYMYSLKLAKDEDRERASLHLVPSV